MASTPTTAVLNPPLGTIPRRELPSFVVAGFLASVVVIGFVVIYHELNQWFVLPVLGCGVLIGIDAINWMRGRYDALDPIGIVGLLGIHFFFLAALLQVAWDHGMSFVTARPSPPRCGNRRRRC